eukprot:symbB.v1.2.027293.t1/scaffold2792.1/size70187/6
MAKLYSQNDRQYVLEAISETIKARLRLCFLSWIAWQQDQQCPCRSAALKLTEVQLVLGADGKRGEPGAPNTRRVILEDKKHIQSMGIPGIPCSPEPVTVMHQPSMGTPEILKRGELRQMKLMSLRSSREVQRYLSSAKEKCHGDQNNCPRMMQETSAERKLNSWTSSSVSFGKRHHAVLKQTRDFLALHLVLHAWKSVMQEHSDGQVCMIPDHVQNLASRACLLAKRWKLVLEARAMP